MNANNSVNYSFHSLETDTAATEFGQQMNGTFRRSTRDFAVTSANDVTIRSSSLLSVLIFLRGRVQIADVGIQGVEKEVLSSRSDVQLYVPSYFINLYETPPPLRVRLSFHARPLGGERRPGSYLFLWRSFFVRRYFLGGQTSVTRFSENGICGQVRGRGYCLSRLPVSIRRSPLTRTLKRYFLVVINVFGDSGHYFAAGSFFVLISITNGASFTRRRIEASIYDSRAGTRTRQTEILSSGFETSETNSWFLGEAFPNIFQPSASSRKWILFVIRQLLRELWLKLYALDPNQK